MGFLAVSRTCSGAGLLRRRPRCVSFRAVRPSPRSIPAPRHSLTMSENRFGEKVPVAAGKAANLEGERPLPSIARIRTASISDARGGNKPRCASDVNATAALNIRYGCSAVGTTWVAANSDRRPRAEPTPDALYDAGHLSLSRSPAGLAQGRRDSRSLYRTSGDGSVIQVPASPTGADDSTGSPDDIPLANGRNSSKRLSSVTEKGESRSGMSNCRVNGPTREHRAVVSRAEHA